TGYWISRSSQRQKPSFGQPNVGGGFQVSCISQKTPTITRIPVSAILGSTGAPFRAGAQRARGSQRWYHQARNDGSTPARYISSTVRVTSSVLSTPWATWRRALTVTGRSITASRPSERRRDAKAQSSARATDG